MCTVVYHCHFRCCRTAISKLRFCFHSPSQFYLVGHRHCRDCRHRCYRYRYCSVGHSPFHIVILLLVAFVDVSDCCVGLVFFLLLLMLSLSLLLFSSLLSMLLCLLWNCSHGFHVGRWLSVQKVGQQFPTESVRYRIDQPLVAMESFSGYLTVGGKI